MDKENSCDITHKITESNISPKPKICAMIANGKIRAKRMLSGIEMI